MRGARAGHLRSVRLHLLRDGRRVLLRRELRREWGLLRGLPGGVRADALIRRDTFDAMHFRFVLKKSASDRTVVSSDSSTPCPSSDARATSRDARASAGGTARASMSSRASWSGSSVPGDVRRRRRASPSRSRRPSASSLATALALCVASALPARVSAQRDCVIQGAVAIFMVYQAENPDAVFFSEDGCLAGGGRGNGCCPGSKCAVCEPNTVQSAGGKEMRWNSCMCEPCEPGAAVPRGHALVRPCPASCQQVRGQTQCDPCPPGTFNSQVGRSSPCERYHRGRTPPRTYARREATPRRTAA